jgi:hypothetical protein
LRSRKYERKVCISQLRRTATCFSAGGSEHSSNPASRRSAVVGRSSLTSAHCSLTHISHACLKSLPNATLVPSLRARQYVIVPCRSRRARMPLGRLTFTDVSLPFSCIDKTDIQSKMSQFLGNYLQTVERRDAHAQQSLKTTLCIRIPAAVKASGIPKRPDA